MNHNTSQSRYRKFKHGAIALAFTVAAVVAVILFNIAASAVADKVKLTVDLSDTKDFTLSEDVKTYLEKDVKRDVTITLCCNKNDYTDGLYQQVLSNFSYGDSSSGTFFKQTVFLLDEIARHSDHITLNYADPMDPSFSAYTNKYQELSMTMGDILIEASYQNDEGETVERHKLLNINDIYNVVDVASEYGENYVYMYNCNYYITGNNIETAVGSAIYSVTSDKTYKVAVITANGGQYVDQLDTFMSANNYEFTNIENLYDQQNAIPEDTDVIIISAPANDYKPKELEIIDDYLASNDSHYRTVLYIASAQQPNLPNLNAFLSEWGFKIEPDHILAETDQGHIRGDSDTSIQFEKVGIPAETNDGSDYFEGVSPTTDYDFIAKNNAVITAKQTLSNGRTVRGILESTDASAAKPVHADDNWKPENSDLSNHIAFGVGYSRTLLNNYDYYYKRVLVLSSIDFINSSFNAYEECGNLNVIMSALDVSCGKNVNSIVFDTRTFDTETFETPTDLAVTVMMIIFVIAIPLVILISCIVIMIIRRRL